MKEEEITHVAYSDEAYYHEGEYSSICLVSLSIEMLELVESSLSKILSDSGLKELKWVKMGSARERICAEKMIDFIYDCIKNKFIRIDTVIWNSKDRKKQIPESNNKILKKMYYHLLKNVLTMRWPSNSIWRIFPDEQGVIDWEEMNKILKSVSSKIQPIKKEDGSVILRIDKNFELKSISEVNSKESPLCQVADFFSGLASFYHLECPILNLDAKQFTLLGNLVELSNRQKERIYIIKYLRDKFSNSSIEITFDLNKGMFTKNPNGQINFWQFKLNLSKHQNQKLEQWF